MSILLKTNSRIKLVAHHQSSLEFAIDGNKMATFHTQTAKVHMALLTFLCKGISWDELQLADSSLTRLYWFIDNLKKSGLIDYYFQFNGFEYAIVSPKSPHFKDSILSQASAITFEKRLHVLSRFAYFRRENDKMVLECPFAPFRAALDAEFFNRFLPFISGKQKLADHDYETLQEGKTNKILLSLLIEGGVIHSFHEEEAKPLRFWEFHDLIFHSRSRRGEFDDNIRFGATYRFQKQLAPPQTFKDIPLDQAIKLYKPNLDELAINDIPFSKVLESRRSIRNYSESKKISINELGEFLYRSIGLREVIKTPKQDAIFRPYPSAGAIHEIEFYLVINACEGISSGIYYYHPEKHALTQKKADRSYIETIISSAKSAMGANANSPQIVFVLTSRFEKIAWKYEKMGYRSTLISLGAIFQTMSLVATSMDLASCILGSGDSALFSEAIDINSLEEDAVGEFALGVSSDFQAHAK